MLNVDVRFVCTAAGTLTDAGQYAGGKDRNTVGVQATRAAWVQKCRKLSKQAVGQTGRQVSKWQSK